MGLFALVGSIWPPPVILPPLLFLSTMLAHQTFFTTYLVLSILQRENTTDQCHAAKYTNRINMELYSSKHIVNGRDNAVYMDFTATEVFEGHTINQPSQTTTPATTGFGPVDEAYANACSIQQLYPPVAQERLGRRWVTWHFRLKKSPNG